jgi:hypothetical protein
MTKARIFTVKCLLMALIVLAPSYVKADMFAGTSSAGPPASVTFTGVKIYGVDGSAADNPWGLSPTSAADCPSCNNNENSFNTGGTPGGGSYEIATITFFSGGAFDIVETTPSSAGNGNTASTYQGLPLTNSPDCPTTTPSFTVSGAILTTPNGAVATECTSAVANPSNANQVGWVFNGQSQNGTGTLTYQGTVNGYQGVFTASDNSEEVTFELSPTPEMPSLALFGSGLLVVGFFLRRKGFVA